MSDPAPASGGGERAAPLVLVLTGAALLVLGAVLGVVGSFLNAATPQLLGVGVPVGPVVAVVGNFAAGVLGTRGTGSRLGGGLPGLGWFVMVALLGSQRAEGDLVVTGDGHGVTFIVLGALASAASLLVGTRGRSGRR